MLALAVAFLAASLAAATSTAATVEVRTLPGGPYEASGGTAVPGGEGLLFVDDGRPGEVLWMRLGADGGAETITPVSLGGTVADPEGITNDGTWIYVVGSQSRGGKSSADLVRFRFDSKAGTASDLQAYRGLPALLSGVVSGKGKKAGALNIEGLAWDDARKRLLLGLRSPLRGGDAMVVPLALGDGPLADGSVTADAPVPLPLGGSGIRSLEQVADGTFLVVAGGVTGPGDFRLLSWSGSGAPSQLTAFTVELKPEGVARVSVGGRPMTVLLGDSGRWAVLE